MTKFRRNAPSIWHTLQERQKTTQVTVLQASTSTITPLPEIRKVFTSTERSSSVRPSPKLDLSFPGKPCFRRASKLQCPAEDRRWIYALVDPFDSTVRYVGKSRDPNARFSSHARANDANSRAKPWLTDLKAKNVQPRMVILSVVNWKQWERAERAWIAYYRKLGTIYNVQDGGRYLDKTTPAPKYRHGPHPAPVWTIPWDRRPPISSDQLEEIRKIGRLPENGRQLAAQKWLENYRLTKVTPLAKL